MSLASRASAHCSLLATKVANSSGPFSFRVATTFSGKEKKQKKGPRLSSTLKGGLLSAELMLTSKELQAECALIPLNLV